MMVILMHNGLKLYEIHTRSYQGQKPFSHKLRSERASE